MKKHTNKSAHQPIVVETPGFTMEKMEAIVSLSSAICTLAQTLASSNTSVTVTQCSFVVPNGPAVSIKS